MFAQHAHLGDGVFGVGVDDAGEVAAVGVAFDAEDLAQVDGLVEGGEGALPEVPDAD